MRLIDADALKDTHIKCPAHISFFDFGEIVELFLQTIDEQPTITVPRWENVEDGLYAVKDGVIYQMKVRTTEGKTIKMPPIKLTDAMRYELPKEDADANK